MYLGKMLPVARQVLGVLGGAVGFVAVTRRWHSPPPPRAFEPNQPPAQFSDADLAEHTLYDRDMIVTDDDIARIEKRVQETGERLPRGRDRQLMLAYLYQLNKRSERDVRAYGPTCWNASGAFNPTVTFFEGNSPPEPEYRVCWDCGRRHD